MEEEEEAPGQDEVDLEAAREELRALARAAAAELEEGVAEGPPPVVSVVEEWDDGRLWAELGASLASRLRATGVETFWPVQRRVLPASLRSDRDLCVSAPTGSGKTLARQVHAAVSELVDASSPGGFRVGLAVGHALRSDEALFRDDGDTDDHHRAGGRRGAPDVLVCTPGRLVEHIEDTPGFTLQHLCVPSSKNMKRYLVVDEADRLLQQNYHNWIDKLISACYSTERGVVSLASSFSSSSSSSSSSLSEKYREPRIDATTRRSFPGSGEAFVECAAPLQKMLFSATLGDASKYAALRLRNAVRFDAAAAGRALPEGLSEETAACSAATKPLCLLAALDQRRASSAMIFCASVDTARRLAALLALWGCDVHECSSRKRADCLTLHQGVIVATDGLARGIDLAHVDLVINYDAPSDVSAYVHRVGRTARAGRTGIALTLLKRGQERAFARLRAEIDETAIPKVKLEGDGLTTLVPKYKACLAELKAALNQPKGPKPRFQLSNRQDAYSSDGGDDDDGDEVDEEADEDTEGAVDEDGDDEDDGMSDGGA